MGPSTSRGAGTLVRCGRSCTYVRRDRRPAAAAAAAEHPTRRRRPCVRVGLCLACSVDHRPRHSTRVPVPMSMPTCGDASLAGFAMLLRGEKRVATGQWRGGRGSEGSARRLFGGGTQRRHTVGGKEAGIIASTGISALGIGYSFPQRNNAWNLSLVTLQRLKLKTYFRKTSPIQRKRKARGRRGRRRQTHASPAHSGSIRPRTNGTAWPISEAAPCPFL